MRLFKKKEDKSSSPAQTENPYAQPVSENPYAQAPQGNPYASSKPSAYTQARQQAYGDSAAQDTKSSYNNDTKNVDNKVGGYGANQYGASGYGAADRYGTGDNKAPTSSRYGAGGYGGFGGRDPYNKPDDPNRNALFGGASERAAQNKIAGGDPPPYDSGSSSAAAGDYRTDHSASGPHNAGPQYQDRQLTAEEEEEESLNATKHEIRSIKQKDVSATRNALRLAQQAEEVGRDTLVRLGVQAEYIHTTERNLDLAHNQNKQAEDKARQLKTLNRSMFALHVSNPLTSKSRDTKRDNKVRERHEEERLEREATRQDQFQAHQRMEKNFADLSSSSGSKKSEQDADRKKKKNLAERAKYQFEADSEDEGMENEIDSNLNALGGVVRNMQRIAVATGEEVDAQNRRFGKIHDKSDVVDNGITVNTNRLKRIH